MPKKPADQLILVLDARAAAALGRLMGATEVLLRLQNTLKFQAMTTEIQAELAKLLVPPLTQEEFTHLKEQIEKSVGNHQCTQKD